ncbi:MAG: X-Pro aminopeptidase [Flavobacteriaceae bacterium]|nr:X-Pro aminopeptidase [Flavobacteriaceae bacterium]|tara:strand:+ start:2452 stop:3741 length:1290 start_codon:yes stop_codon:yes gene_type:complete
MKYDPIENLLFKKNRIKFLAKMDSNSIAVFNSNDNYPVSADTTLPFEQHRDLFYLTGVNQEKTVLILATTGSEVNEFLFITKPNETMMHWEGKKLNHESAYEISGINNVFWVDDLEMKVDELMLSATTIYVNNNEHYRAKVETETREERFNKWIKNKYSKKIFKKSNPILQRLRAVKEQIEIDLIKKACSITEKGFRRILKFVKPGVWEYEIEAEFSHEFLVNRSRKFAYSPIIASGNNSNVLHYIDNNQQCKKGDLLLLDVGAEYANYSSDMTRTIPVSGKFNKRQKDVYNSVLNVKNEATKLLTPGIFWKEHHKEVGKIMTSELLKLGLLDKYDIQNQTKNNPAFKKYFTHGTSHHLGLDTHDYGDINHPIEKNNVFTVEPGIYIPEEGFGIRLEDDVVVTEDSSPINLMKDIPIEIEEIEYLMNLK